MFKGINPVIFLTVFVLFTACKKNDPAGTTTNPTPPGLVGNFLVQVTNRQANQVLINWTKPTIPAGATLRYNVYLSNNLLIQNLSDTVYTIGSLIAGQTYSGKVVAYISSTDSSICSFDIPAFIPGNPADSTYILSRVTDAGGLQLSFDYDLANKRLNSWSKTYSTWYDSTKIFYNAAGKVLSLVQKTSSVTPFEVVPNIFEYDGQGRVTRVYHKKLYSTNESYAFMTTVTFPLDFTYDIESYDSLNYDGLNRVASVYTFSTFNGNSTVPGFYTSYKIFTYAAQNDSLLSKFDVYTRTLSNTFTVSSVNFSGYTNRLNPYYLLFRKFYLMGVENHITTPTFLPYYYYGYSLNAYLTTNPYICTNLNSSVLAYSYDSNNLLTHCISGADFSEWVHFYYTEIKK